MKKFLDKVVIISGGAAGIGLAAAMEFAEQGAKVAVCDIDSNRTKITVEILKSKNTSVKGYSLDICDKEAVDRMICDLIKDWHQIDVLINNAGISKDAQFNKMSIEEFESVIDINLKGTFFMSKAVIPYMIERKYGKVINTTSVSAYNGNFGQSNYAASKAGIIGMTRVMAKELGKYGINVNAVAPGSILTNMYKLVPEEIKKNKLKMIPMRRFGKPEEVAKLFSFLASDDAAYITAQTITIDGGFN